MLNRKMLFLLLIPAFSFLSCNSTAQQQTDLSAKEFENGIKSPNIQVLDVRTDKEFKSGHLKDALLADWTNQQQFVERVQSLDKSKPVYTYCLSGGRSGAAANYLRDKGYTVYNMQGGISAWKKADLPLEEPAAVEQMTLAQYQAAIPADKTVLVDFGAEWCPPCKKMNPVIDSLSKASSLSFALVKIDGGDQIELTKQLNVEALPTFIIYKNNKEVWRKTGIVAAAELQQQLQ